MTTDATWETLDAALAQALDRDVDEREVYLASLEPAVRDALVPLLDAALADDPLLDHPQTALGELASETGAPDVEGGTRVGPYEIEGLVGEGGMGRVYRARRADGAFDQTVAVKVVRQSLALAGSDVAARLRRERALLATLDHPGIARLVDGGETDDGVPYLVTEFVDGAPITDWADAHQLGVRARAELVAEVARAVDHAHRRFVVHRDLKPSNVFVTERDGAARPVVLDFGIAKLLAVADETSGAFPLTQTGMRLLTPAYAAPELYEPGVTVTTAADVYGLGALLYELVTGRRPHDDAPTPGPARTEPTRPSRLVAQTSGTTAFDPARRSRVLRGDLDVICLKALHPDPARRYASAADLAADLDRHLAGRPVEARPDGWTYVAGRFVRRNRAAVAAAALALLALVAGLGVSLAALQSERAALAASEAATLRAEEAADLLAGLFAAADPEPTAGRPVSVREALDQGLGRIQEIESDELRAYLLGVVGRTYIQMGDPYRADSLLREALDAYGVTATSAAASDVRIGFASTRLALGDPTRALALGRRVHRDHRDDPDPVLALRGLRVIAISHSALGQPDSALVVARRVQRLTPVEASAEQRERSLTLLGEAYANVGRFEEAVPTLRKAYALSLSDSGPESVRTTTARRTLASALSGAGAHREAEALLRTSLEYQTRVFGPNTVGYVHAAIADVQIAAGDDRGAAASLDSAIVMTVPLLPPDHPDIAGWRATRAAALGRPQSAPAGRAALPAAQGRR
ncbi:protein kinase domain-containing protein [Rubrivirga sp.]|uniref:protein kinase domain-containing protein n=1 Tax=Rubrivirga sp. TaxID=1885344 RepID=UPI003B525F0A